MGKIFYIMGKSSSGKDTVYKELLSRGEAGLRPVVMYTTRPRRAGETEGEEYHFVSEECMQRMREAGQVIELRSYDTVHGIWYYFTADDGSVDLRQGNYLMLGTLESYRRMREYYGSGCVEPVYIEVEDGERLMRALKRERMQPTPGYEEMCRRFLADQKDFSEEKIAEAGIVRRFSNGGAPDACVNEVAGYIRKCASQNV